MSKYDGLGGFLRAQGADHVPMSFVDIERVTGARLPASAAKYSAWWSNNPSNNVMTKVWSEAGFRAESVDLAGRKLVFRRIRRPAAGPVSRPGGGAPSPEGAHGRRSGADLLDRILQAMRGTVTVAPGVDLAQPTGEAWAAELDG